MDIKSTYFNPFAMQKMEFPDYWSSSAQLQRMYEMRLRASCQFQYAHDVLKHNVFFVTLTFSDHNLKYWCFDEFKIQCFDQDLINNFFKRLRDWLLRYYGITGITYLCAEELGHTTNRPHLHVLFSCPLDAETFYGVIKEIWKFGFIFPDNYEGGTDSHGYYHKPFQIAEENIQHSVMYCTKYMLKDVKNPNNIYDNALSYVTTMAKLGADGAEDAKKDLKRSMPKIKTSLKFGSAYEEYLMNISNTADEYMDNCLNGIALDFYQPDQVTTMCKYTKNRLYFKNVLDHIEGAVYDDKGKLLRKKRYVYYRYRTDLYKTIRKERFDKIVNDYANNLQSDIVSIVLDNSYANYCRCNHIPYDISLLNALDLQGLSVYANYFRNRVSIPHMYDYLTNRKKYDVHHYDYDVNVRSSIVRRMYDGSNDISFIDSTITQTDYLLPTFQSVENLDSNPFVRYDNFSFDFPIGNEDINYMKKFAYVLSTMEGGINDYAKDLYLHDFPVNEFVLYNSFPCFKGFDEILTLISEYRFFKRKQKDGVLEDILNDKDFLLNKNLEDCCEASWYHISLSENK